MIIVSRTIKCINDYSRIHIRNTSLLLKASKTKTQKMSKQWLDIVFNFMEMKNENDENNQNRVSDAYSWIVFDVNSHWQYIICNLNIAYS